ncbi:riboflavin kinase [Candidatus Daviesbacteria bacterium]|nr:riboflavin kinase [Candidatus Daviesbacteria bacterium]
MPRKKPKDFAKESKNMFRLWGKVKRGQSRGKKLGFPTANINLHNKMAQGVYVSKIKIKSQFFTALTFIGNATTFNEENYLAESYILNFDKDIYGEFISVYLLKKIRGNIKFKTANDLIKQMKKDEKQALEYFKQ